MRTLILNSQNIIPGSNNSNFKYVFPGGNIKFVRGQKVALASLTSYYSTFNITKVYNNNTFSYIWVDNTQVNITVPDGFYDITTLNAYLQQQFLYNGHFLINNDSGQYVYFITIGSNVSAYSFEVNCFPMNATDYPIGVGAGTYTLGTKQPSSPSPVWVVPTANIVPMFVVPNTNFQYLIGFQPGYYPQGSPTNSPATISGVPPDQTQAPSYSAVQGFLSTFTPQITPYSSFILTCSLLNNNYAVPNTLLYCYAPQGNFGEQFTISPTGQFSFIDIQPGEYNSFTMTIIDQDLFPVALQDPQTIILLVITDPDEKITK
jgi:hypothetical protein